MDQATVFVGDFSAYSTYFLFLVASYLTIFKVMKIFSVPESPMLTYYKGNNGLESCDEATCSEKDKGQIEELIRRCALLKEPYIPPWLWGRNGHVQTAVYGILGRHAFATAGKKRHYVTLEDGTTVTFDVFEPAPGQERGDITLALCPGIGSSSESTSVRRCAHYAQMAGFRCAVLNHLGALKDERLTSPRVFRYGGTEEYDAMMTKILAMYPDTKIVVIGFSMGANIVTKYLGERASNNPTEKRILLGVSICQGYDAVRYGQGFPFTASRLHRKRGQERGGPESFVLPESKPAFGLRNQRQWVNIGCWLLRQKRQFPARQFSRAPYLDISRSTHGASSLVSSWYPRRDKKIQFF